ncbi:MAG: hypothetical protein LKE46_08615 [Clostridium sp.]|jgi:hypothetical protein|uniref:hypothetical protein n=1 Tax=Clostridium sp. TaxID=1506 RepID=UPI0025BE61F4|nr:hypothetical protein [Clostridium sp.]MCH3964327.1 hypothetical protein [Clostridium sp.]MCI1715502.1 hypothetical protein [Clostridium sp.]MCI1799706.1 hypothetical protein [Clostridium sp.]MCI1813686.1 hypothetical protein [Clostridium sp.]MCI1870519.1 hypothetical protein [Clostridium sp.]
MEFRLNKVDPEVRQRVKETTSSSKVHNKREIFINNDQKNKGKSGEKSFDTELKKYKQGKNKKRIMVQASRVEEVEVKAFREDWQTVSKDDGRGNILDVKK